MSWAVLGCFVFFGLKPLSKRSFCMVGLRAGLRALRRRKFIENMQIIKLFCVAGCRPRAPRGRKQSSYVRLGGFTMSLYHYVRLGGFTDQQGYCYHQLPCHHHHHCWIFFLPGQLNLGNDHKQEVKQSLNQISTHRYGALLDWRSPSYVDKTYYPILMSGPTSWLLFVDISSSINVPIQSKPSQS